MAVAVGIAVTMGSQRLGDDAPEGDATVLGADEVTTLDEGPGPRLEAPATGATPAQSPLAAVETFLAAEVSGDLARSHRLLSDADRATYPNVAAWTSAHADFFPIESFDVVRADGDQVVTTVRYRSSLDEVVGLVPARADVTWTVVPVDGGWLVDHGAARLQALHPEDAEAVDAVVAWSLDRQRCRRPEEYGGGLVATADLVAAADELCDGPRPMVAATVGTLDGGDASAFVSAFGPQATGWARTVAITAPVQLTVVLAPVDDRWLVVGLLP